MGSVVLLQLGTKLCCLWPVLLREATGTMPDEISQSTPKPCSKRTAPHFPLPLHFREMAPFLTIVMGELTEGRGLGELAPPVACRLNGEPHWPRLTSSATILAHSLSLCHSKIYPI